MTARDDVREFASWVIQQSAFSGADLYGFDCQDKALALGLIVETKYDPALHGEYDCEPGDTFYVFSDELSAPRSDPRPSIYPTEWIEQTPKGTKEEIL